MRSTQTCPKCLGKRFAVTPEFGLPEGAVHVEPVPAICFHANYVGHQLGKLESWICLGCGYTELYAYGLDGVTSDRDGLEALARKFPNALRIVDASPQGQGPYR